MSGVDMSPAAVSARLRRLGELCDLNAEKRLHTKVDMSAKGVSARLRAAGDALELCRRLAARVHTTSEQ
jgi:hypothetical protein